MRKLVTGSSGEDERDPGGKLVDTTTQIGQPVSTASCNEETERWCALGACMLSWEIAKLRSTGSVWELKMSKQEGQRGGPLAIDALKTVIVEMENQ